MTVSRELALERVQDQTRLAVLENGRLCGMVRLGDLAMQDETSIDAGDALTEISNNLSSRDGRL